MENEQQSEKVVKIVKQERIDRILSRVCSAKLEVLIRTRKNKSVAVRGKADLLNDRDDPASLTIRGLSDQGARYLWKCDQVQVEFVGMSTQIVFNAAVLNIEGTSLRLVKPAELISFDRRANARYTVNERFTSFMQFGAWLPGRDDLVSPPVIELFSKLSGWVAVADISEGGICCVSRFPGFLDALPKGMIDRQAKMILPLHAPLDVPVEVRWARRIKESKELGDTIRHQRFFRLGLQFVEPSEEFKIVIKQYVNQLSVAEAI